MAGGKKSFHSQAQGSIAILLLSLTSEINAIMMFFYFMVFVQLKSSASCRSSVKKSHMKIVIGNRKSLATRVG